MKAPAFASMKRLILFDFDGTLVDIQPVFFAITNRLAQKFGYSPLTPVDLPQLKNLSLAIFLWQRLGWRILLFPWILKAGRKEYHQLIPQVQLFSGMKELIETLRLKECKIGIVSSSTQATVVALLKKFGIDLTLVVHSSLFNKAQILKETIEQNSFTISQTIYIGDEVRDVRACQKIGLDVLAVTWGLNSKQALQAANATTVDTRNELLSILLDTIQ